MFNWVWDLLYGISKSIFAIIDNLLACANMLCGIQPVKYQNTDMDFMTFLIRNKNIYYGFVSAVLIGVILVFIFAAFAVIRSMSSEKDSMTPGQIVVKVGKTLLTFIFIPAALMLLIFLVNTLMNSLYMATQGGSQDGLGRFLAGAFGQNAYSGNNPYFYLEEGFNYRSTGSVKSYLDLSDYDFFFSWIAGICILIALASSLLMFVDRAISIVILFIVSPISMSTAILDDGQRFKLWRDQFLVKFLTGYGCIIGINIYALVIAAITQNDLVFFEDNTLNNVMKIAIIVGGGVSMNRLMALIGNLISAGAGSNELRDNAIATSQARGAFSRMVLAPFKATRGAINFVKDSKQYGIGSTIGQRFGVNTDRSYGKMSATQKAQNRENLIEGEKLKRSLTGAGNQGGGDSVKNAIQGPNNNGGGNNAGGGGGSNNAGGKGNANNNIGNKMIEMNVLNKNNNNNDKGNKK